MAAVTFDTLKFAKTLKAAGVSEPQAEAQANAISEALQVNLKDLATKDDLKMLELAMKSEIQQATTELKEKFPGLKGEFVELRGEFAGLKGEMKVLAVQINHLKWIFGVGTSITLAMLGIVLRLLLVRGV
jgi:hypothetical protein